ncbi:CPS_collapsed_G0054220.mRNA.1.CDS.1 [Saccharomyces cerevisiae]|nr:CPS_collapsed_G0054220.mRNA.1.CDS.1 [Saccharomyces cerevisiae]
MAELNDYSTMIDILLSDMDLETVTTKKVRDGFERKEKNDSETKGTHVEKKKGTVSKSPISTRKVTLSKSLASLLGEHELTRTEVSTNMFEMHKILASHMTEPKKISDCPPLIQEVRRKEKPIVSDSEQSDTKGI